MNTLKSLLFLAVLAAAACGVYVSLNRNPESPVPPGLSQGSPNGPVSPKIEMPGSNPVPTAPGSNSPAFPGSNPPGSPTSAGLSFPSFPGAPVSGGASGTAVQAPSPPNLAAAPASQPFGAMPPPVATASVAAAADSRFSQTGRDLSPSTGATLASLSGGPSPQPGPNASALPTDGARNCKALVESVMETVENKVEQGRLGDALRTLSSLYGNRDLPPDQAGQVTRLLDQMAATVIYSRQHLLEPSYKVQPGDTLDRIADQYSVPSQLLARINGICDPQNLTPGRDLKVIRGPFTAMIDLAHFELTLMVDGHYAGRFPIGLGVDGPHNEGTYIVQEKRADPASGNSVAGHSRFWIDLGSHIAIHTAAEAGHVGRSDGRGSICVGERDMEDLYGILSVGSRVVIQR